MQDKIFLDDYVNIVEVCTPKCISTYSESRMTPNERMCLEKCYFKSLSMNKHISQNFGNLMSQQ